MNYRIIDTDLTDRHFENCITNNTKIIRLLSSCDRDFEYKIFFESLWRSHLGHLIPSMLALVIVSEAVYRIGRARIASICFAFSMVLLIIFGFFFKSEHVIWIGGTAQAFILVGIATLTLLAIENYTTPLR